ncbi:cytochrome P450 [Frankia sp. R82]|uniref:cytochrome P450 family protein n=1 Tax=Frankia sp. R82 TaxID=2950553 RepID=UPI002043AE72|nr:cytochrome P450 [Frankia sp. R82]MCM3887455.1 cytochrome P450 [Frankia sp. R82]
MSTSRPGTRFPADMLTREFAQQPYPEFARLRADGSVARVPLKTFSTAVHAWLVTRYDDARRLLADPRLSKDAGRIAGVIRAHAVESNEQVTENPPSMLFSDPPDHTRLRRLVGGAFTARRVQGLVPDIERYTDEALAQITPGEVVDFVEQVALPVPMAVIGALLGIPEDAFGDFREWSARLGSVGSSLTDKQKVIADAYGYVRELIERRRAEPADDLISALLAADDEAGGLSTTELLSTVFLIMNAGYETTAAMLSSSVLLLHQHPALRAGLAAEPSRVPAFVEETLRYESPLNLSTIRFTQEAIEVAGTVIPAGEIVFISLCAANRDAARFADADIVRPARESGHLAFGHGIHHCLGAPLARLEGRIVLQALLARHPDWRLAVPEHEVVWRHSLQFRGLESLPVRFG